MKREERSRPTETNLYENPPVIIEGDPNAGAQPQSEAWKSDEPGLGGAKPATSEESADAEPLIVPTTPVVELAPGVEAADEQQAINGSAPKRLTSEPSVSARPAFSNLPTTGVKAPTF